MDPGQYVFGYGVGWGRFLYLVHLWNYDTL